MCSDRPTDLSAMGELEEHAVEPRLIDATCEDDVLTIADPHPQRPQPIGHGFGCAMALVLEDKPKGLLSIGGIRSEYKERTVRSGYYQQAVQSTQKVSLSHAPDGVVELGLCGIPGTVQVRVTLG